MRNELAVIDFNEHRIREFDRKEDGSQKYRALYSKRTRQSRSTSTSQTFYWRSFRNELLFLALLTRDLGCLMMVPVKYHQPLLLYPVHQWNSSWKNTGHAIAIEIFHTKYIPMWFFSWQWNTYSLIMFSIWKQFWYCCYRKLTIQSSYQSDLLKLRIKYILYFNIKMLYMTLCLLKWWNMTKLCVEKIFKSVFQVHIKINHHSIAKITLYENNSHNLLGRYPT